MRALDFDDTEVLAARYGTFASLPPLPEASVTLPNLVVTPPACVSVDVADGVGGTEIGRAHV